MLEMPATDMSSSLDVIGKRAWETQCAPFKRSIGAARNNFSGGRRFATGGANGVPSERAGMEGGR
jgi:hypothetical protein